MALAAGWTNTIDKALTDPSWDDYDATIVTEVNRYRTRLNLQANWLILKAQIWVESGASSIPAWKTRPMQIGNPGDPGYATLKENKENSPLIMSDQLKLDLKRQRSCNDPVFNIQLGVAYVYTKLCIFRSVVSNNSRFIYEVKLGDQVDKIAITLGTTKQNIYDLNVSARSVILPKQKLVYQKAAVRPVSIEITPGRLQSLYNGSRDIYYAEKINYCLDIISKLKR